MTERTYAINAILNLQDAGWTLSSASDGEERIVPTSATAAVEHVMATEHGAVRLVKGHQRINLSMLFQGSDEGEEVIYDYSSNGDLDEVQAIISKPR